MVDPIDNDFPRWLRVVLQERGLSSAHLARAMNVRDSTVSRWFRGGSTPNQKTIRSLASVLDVPVIEVLVASGYLTAEEAQLKSTASLYLVDSEELLGEVRRRMYGT